MYSIHYKQNEKYGLLSVALFVAYYTLNVIGGAYIKVLLVLAMIMACCHVLKNFVKTTKILLLVLLCIVAIILIRLSISNDIRLAVICLIVLATMYVDVDHLIEWMFYSKLISFPIAFILGGYKGNPCALHGGILILLYLCKNRKNLQKKHLLVSLVASIILFLYTNTGALLISVGIAVVLFSYKEIFGKTRIFHWGIIRYIFPLALFANVICVLVFVDGCLPIIGSFLPSSINALVYKFVTFIDVATSHRIALAASSWPIFGVSLFGGNIDYSLLNLYEGVYFYLDSGMMWLLQGWGIVATIVFMILTIWVMDYLLKEKEYVLLICGIIIALWAINEDLLLSVDTNFLIALFGNAIINRRNLMRIEI